MGFIKFKNLCSPEDTIKKLKIQAPNLKKDFQYTNLTKDLNLEYAKKSYKLGGGGRGAGTNFLMVKTLDQVLYGRMYPNGKINVKVFNIISH